MLSNFGRDTLVDVLRTQKLGDNEIEIYDRAEVLCPKIICIYALNAKSVDLFGQIICYYEVDHKSRKWYFRIMVPMFQLALHNSFILYLATHQEETPLALT